MRSVLVSTLLTLSFGLQAQWTPKLSNHDNGGFLDIEHYSFLSHDRGFGMSHSGLLFQTDDDFHTFTTIYPEWPAPVSVEYMEMLSKREGLLVLKTIPIREGEKDSIMVFTTHNGGYLWEKAFVFPWINESLQRPFYLESMFFQRYKNRLFILYGDVVCHGLMNGKEWQYTRYPETRRGENLEFRVVNDSIWLFKGALPDLESSFTTNAGKTWNDVWTLGHMTLFLTLENGIQKFAPGNLFLEYQPKDDSWVELSMPYGYKVENIVQLNSSEALLNCWHWPSSTRKHLVYHRKKDTWTHLDTLSDFFDPFGRPVFKQFVTKGNGFVANHRVTYDYGQSWSDLVTNTYLGHGLGVTFSTDVSVALSSYQTLFSIDKGQHWKKMFTHDLWKDLPASSYHLSYQNDAHIWLIGKEVRRIIPQHDSIELVEEKLDFGVMAPPQILEICDKPGMDFYVLGTNNQWLYLFKKNTLGQLEVEMSLEWPGLGPSTSAQMIQNAQWVVFWLNNAVYGFRKKDKRHQLLTNELVNSLTGFCFIGMDSIFGGNGQRYFTANLEEGKEGFEVMPSVLTNLYHHALSDSGVHVYYRNFSPVSFQAHMLGKPSDTVTISPFLFSEYTGLLRFWGQTPWFLGRANLYEHRNKGLDTDPIPCVVTENMWPNPVSHHLNVRYFTYGSHTLSLTLYDVNGRLLLSRSSSNTIGLYEEMIDMNAYQAGLYFLHLSSKGCSPVIKKVIKR